MSTREGELRPAADIVSHDAQSKPRLVFFQYRYDPRLPEFLLLHKTEHVRCLSHFFDVIVINEDCDYLEVCDRYQPSMVLFEAGVNHETCIRPRIENVRHNASVPKAAIHHADAWCNARAGFLSDLATWDIDTVFAISTTAGEHNPGWVDNLFYWPVFVDGELFRDYGLAKTIPVLLTGNTNALYPWRSKVFRLIRDRLPAMTCPHSGYGPNSGLAGTLVGERYARTMNASWCVPTCGTVAREVIRKHFEAPASKACLITERSEGLEMAGFEDGRTCLFVDEHDVLDKLVWLLSNEGEMNKITEAGHALVHSRHTSRQRDQIWRWFNLQQSLKPSEKIVQLNPFDAPVVTSRSAKVDTTHVSGRGLHLQAINEGDQALERGEYARAERAYLRCLNCMPWMPEPRLRLAVTSLYMGKPSEAERRLEPLLQFVLFKYKAEEPDPVEWAYYIVAAICRGDLREADERAKRFPALNHPELQRARWACRVLAGGGGVQVPHGSPAQSERRRTIHRLKERQFIEWVDQLCAMLRASGRAAMANALRDNASKRLGEPISICRNETPASKGADAGVLRPSPRRLFLRMQFQELKWRLRRTMSSVLHRAERRFGYFLPFRLSSIRSDELFVELSRELEDEEISCALLIGAADRSPITEAFFYSLRRNRRQPLAFCVPVGEGVERDLSRHCQGIPNVKWCRVSTASEGTFVSTIDEITRTLMKEVKAGSRAIIVVDGESLRELCIDPGLQLDVLEHSSVVVLSATDVPFVFEMKRRLEQSSNFEVRASNASSYSGFAVLRRRDAAREGAAHNKPYSHIDYDAAERA